MTLHLGAEKLEHLADCEVCKARIELMKKYGNSSKAVRMAYSDSFEYEKLSSNCKEAKKLMKMKSITDELCFCSHLKSQHNDKLFTKLIFSKGHGSCILCECIKFTWKSFIY